MRAGGRAAGGGAAELATILHCPATAAHSTCARTQRTRALVVRCPCSPRSPRGPDPRPVPSAPRPRRYTGYGLFFAGVYTVYHAKPLESLDIKYWARPRAEKELEVEMRMLDKLNERPDLQDRLKAVAKGLNLVEEEAYDLVFMRNEYKVLMGLHSGRVPAELADIYEELAASA